MIKNEKQYRIAKANLQKWEKNLEINSNLTPAEFDNWLVKEQEFAITEQVQQLSRELREYELLVASGTSNLPDLSIINEIPSLLIQWRIAQNLTQKELAASAGIHENLLQKYEQEDYGCASLKTIMHIAKILKTNGRGTNTNCSYKT